MLDYQQIFYKSYKYLKTASKYGDVYVGLLTDQAIASYKNIPYLDYEKEK